MAVGRRAIGLTPWLLALAAGGAAVVQDATIRQYQFVPRADGSAYEVDRRSRALALRR